MATTTTFGEEIELLQVQLKPSREQPHSNDFSDGTNNMTNNKIKPHGSMKPSHQKTSQDDDQTQRFVLYERRWIVLAVFSIISMTNEVIWISLSSIASIVKEYYGVSYLAVNWLSMVYMLFYVFVFVAAFALDRLGLKFTIMIGAVLNGLGSCLRLIGTNRNGFVFVFLGNASAALAQCFILFVPPSLAATWFGEKERATASAIGVLMNMLGVAIGFLMGGTIVPGTSDYDGAVRNGIFKTLLIQAIFCTIMVVCCLVLVRDCPESPPSMSQLLVWKNKQKKQQLKKVKSQESASTTASESTESSDDNTVVDTNNFKKSLSLLARDRNFHLVAQAYGIYFGIFAAYNTVLNQWCMIHFPGREQEIGLMGFTSVILGLIGIFLAGVWLDKTARYKFISIGTFLACGLSLLTFTLILVYSGHFVMVYVSFSIFGFFSYPYITVGLEHAAEITYPISEGFTSGILLLVGNMYAIILTFICGEVINKGRSDIAGYLMTSLYVIGLLIVAFMKGELKRLHADNSSKEKTLDVEGETIKGELHVVISRHA